MSDDERYISPVDRPTDYQIELLTILMEECAEVIHRASKIIRFGFEEIQPGKEGLTNLERFSAEIGDLFYMIERCKNEGMVDEDEAQHSFERKEKRLAKYMQSEKD